MATSSVGLIVLGILLGLLLVLVLYELRRLRSATQPEPVARLEARVDALAGQLGERVGESTAASRDLAAMVGRQLDDANRSFQRLVERLGRLDEATRQVEQVGRSIAGLEQLLASPKRRGGLGEWSLEMLLAEALPAEQVARQHRLVSRDVVVDIAVHAPDGRLVAIDSKFPVEAYRRLVEAEDTGAEAEPQRRELHRAVRTRVDEIARKYISPEDGTVDFALMFIPSEAVYYELAVRAEGGAFAAYSRARRVLLCSPNTLYAYLQSLALGLRGLKIAEHARRIHATLDHLRQDVTDVRTLLERAGTQFRNAVGNIEGAGDALGKIETRLDRITELEEGREEEPSPQAPSQPPPLAPPQAPSQPPPLAPPQVSSQEPPPKASSHERPSNASSQEPPPNASSQEQRS